MKWGLKEFNLEDMRNDEEGVKEDILEAIQTLFQSAFVVRVNFSSATYQ